MLCKAENRDPAHCLKEGRRVTRCAQDLCVILFSPRGSAPLTLCDNLLFRTHTDQHHQITRKLPVRVREALELSGVQQPGASVSVPAVSLVLLSLERGRNYTLSKDALLICLTSFLAACE